MCFSVFQIVLMLNVTLVTLHDCVGSRGSIPHGLLNLMSDLISVPSEETFRYALFSVTNLLISYNICRH